MPGVKRSFRVAGETRVFEGVCGEFREQGYWARSLAKRESSPTTTGVIEVIHAAPRSTTVTRKGVLTIVLVESYSDKQPLELEKKMKFS